MSTNKAVSLTDLLPNDDVQELMTVIAKHKIKTTSDAEISDGFKALAEKIIPLFEKHKDSLAERSYTPEHLTRCIIVELEAMLQTAMTVPQRISPPCRVQVFDGSGTKVIGEGTYVSDVPVYVIVMPDGSLKSNTIAEEKIPEDQIPKNGTLREIPSNPKIEMDNGEIVYGCQVYWRPIPEASEDPTNFVKGA